MVEEGRMRNIAKSIIFKAAKASLKSFIFYVLYLFVWSFLVTFESYAPNLRQTVENFVIIYIILGIFRDLTSETVFQHFFEVAKAFFVIGYLILALSGGMVSMVYMGIALTIDLRLFLMAAILLSLLGLSKSILQAINYLNKKAELV